jgi:putative transposase
VRYAFIKAEAASHAVRTLCRMMQVHPSGYYAWCRQSESARAKEDRRLLGHIKHSWLESGSVYGYRKVHRDLRELGLECGKHRVARLMRTEGLAAQRGYRRRPRASGGEPSVLAPNLLARRFSVAEPNQAWVTDITYIRTYEGWLYLAVVLDLFSRQVVGWSMGSRIDRELVLNALLMAVWRRQPKAEVLVHSDQGSQFTSEDWQDFLVEHGLKASMSRRGNCYDNAVAESFFQLLKRERIRRKTYDTRDAARREVFEYIELFYNPKRRHGASGAMSPVDFEKQHFNRLATV